MKTKFALRHDGRTLMVTCIKPDSVVGYEIIDAYDLSLPSAIIDSEHLTQVSIEKQNYIQSVLLETVNFNTERMV